MIAYKLDTRATAAQPKFQLEVHHVAHSFGGLNSNSKIYVSYLGYGLDCTTSDYGFSVTGLGRIRSWPVYNLYNLSNDVYVLFPLFLFSSLFFYTALFTLNQQAPF